MDGEQRLLPMTIGLFGRDAPRSVEVFKQLVQGTLVTGCREPEADADPMAMQRGKLSTKAVFKQCVAMQAEPVSYAYSQVWRIQRGKRIDHVIAM